MRILIYGINYAPELTGIGKYTGEMAAWLARQNHEVEVITALPYYPEWQIHEKYKGKWWMTEVVEGVKIHRCPLYVPAKVNSIKRIVHEFSFLGSIFPLFLRSLFSKKFDLIISVSPPFHLGILPMLYAKLRGTKFISHIQDLQVDAARDLKMIKNKFALDMMFKLEKNLFENSSAVSTISTGMKSKIVAKGIPSSKIILFPNWVDQDMVRPLPREQSLIAEFGLSEDSKVILYSGNLGEKQGLEVIIEVAKALQSRKDVVFVIVGSGGGKANLMKLANDANLNNIRFFPLQPYNKLSALLATADVHLVLQKKSASDLVMPSKLTAILASGGCPIVSAVPGTTLYDVISDHDLGILIEPESPDALLQGIQRALASDLSHYRNNARKYSELYLSKENILRQWEATLFDIVQTKKEFVSNLTH
ncbi:colanic acid biosynthesis glycosyltransferase WcaI [Dyadobacter endophyticus]|uniref:Colanic acid biosynthesis glycosyltransferase WcaI n=1 Tax=Dyadobacter endophyticus TaxID=1749036 RepID=A0ABQ1ZB51_9BACT|nr:WcaI family glycosyltransferase [Dyadobacter endophyticus]GGH56110.1 colanic acid biosynthesis glycosyltransferase WcaI [Dyadobacter endophyticus]